MKITFEIEGCQHCPYCVTGKTYGNDGRDGCIVYICEKGAYGNFGSGLFEGYCDGLAYKPSNIHHKCPLNKK